MEKVLQSQLFQCNNFLNKFSEIKIDKICKKSFFFSYILLGVMSWRALEEFILLAFCVIGLFFLLSILLNLWF